MTSPNRSDGLREKIARLARAADVGGASAARGSFARGKFTGEATAYKHVLALLSSTGSGEGGVEPSHSRLPQRLSTAADFLTALRETNQLRLAAWCEGGDLPNALFHAAELGGEVGEVLNVVKKLEREAMGWRGSRASVSDLEGELADVLICLDKLAAHYGVDLVTATTDKFNATSEKVGLPHRLSASPSPTDLVGLSTAADDDLNRVWQALSLARSGLRPLMMQSEDNIRRPAEAAASAIDNAFMWIARNAPLAAGQDASPGFGDGSTPTPQPQRDGQWRDADWRVNWLIRQAKDDRLTPEERLSIIANFPPAEQSLEEGGEG